MSFVSYLKRNVGDHETFMGLEADMNEALELEFAEEVRATPSVDAAGDLEIAAVAPAPARPDGEARLTSTTKKYLSSFDTFEAQFKESQDDLKDLSEKIASLSVAQHLTRDFLNLVQASIYGANELELSNKDLNAKNRALGSQVESLRALNTQLKTTVEDLQRRETKLQQEKEVLKSALSTANSELAEAREDAASSDSEAAELRRELATKTSLAEKLMRENELHREKHVNLSVDLDAALKANSEARRKQDEMSNNLKNTSGELSDVREQLTDAQKEIALLNKELENRANVLAETTEALRTVEYERDDLASRHKSEIHAAKSENQNLENRFQAASREQAKATEELISLKLQLNDTVSEKRVAEEKLASMVKEIEAERREHSMASTKLSEINLERASEKVVVETAQQQIKDFQSEISKLKAEIKRLQPFERLYRSAKDGAADEAASHAADKEAERAEADAPRDTRAAAKTGQQSVKGSGGATKNTESNPDNKAA